MNPSADERRHSNRRADGLDANTLIDGLVDDLAPVTPMRWQAAAFGVFTVMAIGLAVLAVTFGIRSVMVAGRVDAVFLLSTGLLACLSAASVHGVIRMARPQVGSGGDGLLWPIAMASLLPLSAVLVGLLDWLQNGHVEIDASGMTCLAMGLSLGVLVAVVLVAWLRLGAPTSPERAGWLVGVASGAAGTFVYSLHCPDSGILHIGVWHGGSVALGAVLGRAAVPALIRW